MIRETEPPESQRNRDAPETLWTRAGSVAPRRAGIGDYELKAVSSLSSAAAVLNRRCYSQNSKVLFLVALLASEFNPATAMAALGPPGWEAHYALAPGGALRETTVAQFTLRLGAERRDSPRSLQWLELAAAKANGHRFRVWVLAEAYPQRSLSRSAASIERYVFQEGEERPKEFLHRVTGRAVLPATGAWEFLWPQPETGGFTTHPAPSRVNWLGHSYNLKGAGYGTNRFVAPAAHRVELLPDVLVGVPSNSRTKDDARRWDGSDYEMVRLNRSDYAEMIRAGMNCFRVDAEQAAWLADEPVFAWGVGGKDVPFPECLFRSTWVGPALFLDEPAVHTRDYRVRPRLAKEPALRQTISPEFMFQEFTNEFHHAVGGAPWSLIQGFRHRADVNLGAMNFPQRNLYSWETMIASAAWQLTGEPEAGPRAVVFEPPGRLGSRRTLPEMNMAYGCQLLPENPANLAGILFGFLRGAARAAEADWGVSIYGAVDRADAPWLFTHAYDQGATHFFFWDNSQLACVPYGECLALARHLQGHVRSHPVRDLARLRRAAEVLILLPPGYDLGHTHMGRGNLWGITELNLERKNRAGVRYRQVMGNFFTEIERCLRQGVAFDLRWDLPHLKHDGYREIVRVREDGRVEIAADGRRTVRRTARAPERPTGRPPQLRLELSGPKNGSSPDITARALITEGSAPVYYTPGTDRNGVYQNTMVLWELFGPGTEDYRQLSSRIASPPAADRPPCSETQFAISQPGRYRLRAATADLAGRSAATWKEFSVAEGVAGTRQ